MSQERSGMDEAGARLRDTVQGYRGDFLDFLQGMVELESPTDVPATQAPVQRYLENALDELGFRSERVPGEGISGGHLVARGPGDGPVQLLVGHTDTVWPLGTLDRMAARTEEGRFHGPGSLDMKGGLTMMVFALRALRELDLSPALTPVALINSDEEIGSPESRPLVEEWAARAARAFVLEPALGEEGRIKTARKGVGHFTVTVHGHAAHAGLDPEAGASAIQELSHVIQSLHALNDPEHGISVNVGVVTGGVRPNVVAPRAEARIDLRVRTLDDGRRMEGVIHGLEATLERTRLEVKGSVVIPPLEATPRNQALWRAARAAGREVGLDLAEATAGGASDGNTTSRFTATLDGLGCVGDGAHADHEHIRIAETLDRCALLARLLLLPSGSGDGE